MNNETCNFERIRYFTIIVNGHLKNNKNHSIRILSMVKKISSSLDARECSTNVERIHTAEYFKMPDERLKGGNQGAVARFPPSSSKKGFIVADTRHSTPSCLRWNSVVRVYAVSAVILLPFYRRLRAGLLHKPGENKPTDRLERLFPDREWDSYRVGGSCFQSNVWNFFLSSSFFLLLSPLAGEYILQFPRSNIWCYLYLIYWILCILSVIIISLLIVNY